MEKKSVLIADDETNLCRILEAKLRKAGYSVTAVHDGVQAVEEARRSDFQVIILDVRMPVMDGLGALREIRKFRAETPIIVMSAYEDQATTAEALSSGATTCVNKPFDLESLVGLVKATLDGGNVRKSVDFPQSVRPVLFREAQAVVLEVCEGEHAGEYQSRIEDKDNETVTVACPLAGEGHVIPRVGTPISIGFAGEDAFYSFETTVFAIRDDDAPSIVIGKPATVYRVQRRKYPRLAARVPVDMALVERSTDGVDRGPTFRVHTEDIGPGGLKIVTEKELPEGAEIEIQALVNPKLAGFAGSGKIARARKTNINNFVGWEYGVQFTKVEDEARGMLTEMVESGMSV